MIFQLIYFNANHDFYFSSSRTSTISDERLYRLYIERAGAHTHKQTHTKKKNSRQFVYYIFVKFSACVLIKLETGSSPNK